MPTYHTLNENIPLSRNQIIVIYANCFFTALIFFALLIIILKLNPVLHDANLLIQDAGQNLNSFSSLLPDLQVLIPQAKNTTIIIRNMVPEIEEGLYIIRQMCQQYPGCHL